MFEICTLCFKQRFSSLLFYHLVAVEHLKRYIFSPIRHLPLLNWWYISNKGYSTPLIAQADMCFSLL